VALDAIVRLLRLTGSAMVYTNRILTEVEHLISHSIPYFLGDEEEDAMAASARCG
jgi:hypothetical protein